jgi:hypothetical protein
MNWRIKTLVFVALCVLPAVAFGEVVKLRDGSSLKGRLVAVTGDSLSIRLAVGARIQVHRSQVLLIAFDEDALPPAGMGLPAGAAAPMGKGTLTVAFKDRTVSSKISIEKKKDWDAHVRANHIIVEVMVDGQALYTAIDSTMDKTVYKGHITQLKNEMTLIDVSVEVPAGVHQCEVVIRNRDEIIFREDFDPEPCHAALAIDELEIPAGRGARIEVGIDKGTFKLGKAKLYRVE